MDTKDATLVFLIESANCPSVAVLARSAYGRLVEGAEVDYRVLDDLIAEASAKGVLRSVNAKYPEAFDAIVSPILQEIGRRKPITSSRPEWHPTPGCDLLS